MIDSAASETRQFQIGVVNATLHTRVRGLLDRFTSLYDNYLVEKPQARTIHVEVTATPFSLSLWKRRRYQVVVNEKILFEPTRSDGVLPYVEWAINLQVPQVMPEYLQLHASAMEVDGQGIIFPAHSGSGKSTLTAGLMTRGWRYLCDEFALIHADTLVLHPYPRGICIKKPSYPVIRKLGLKLHGDHQYLKGSKGRVGFIKPTAVGPNAVGRACPIRYVVFPKYTEGAEPSLIPISRADAVFALHEVCFNLLRCRSLGLDVLANMIRGASCYRLVAGEIHATCDLLEGLIRADQCQRAISA